MDASARIEQALRFAVAIAGSDDAPPLLAAAMDYAVFPGGARVRPRLCLAVAAACGDDHPALADAAASSIELMHCASLVHDDLPCFDDAATRRGKPSVHKMFDERLAVLAGDALIVMSFDVLARAGADAPGRLGGLVRTICSATGAPRGITAGQAWECEPAVELASYHRAKTGSLFAAATVAGAVAAGADPGPWRLLGERIGEAYQVADDIHDAAGEADELGKPIGRDEELARPSAVRDLGLDGAIDRLERLVAEGVGSIPQCPGAAELRALIQLQAKRFLPKHLVRRAA